MDIKEFKHQTRPSYQGGSLIRKYTNGYEAHFIDRHPHGKFYRTVNNGSGINAFPDEEIMLLQTCGIVVMFLKDRTALKEIEKSMNLVSE